MFKGGSRQNKGRRNSIAAKMAAETAARADHRAAQIEKDKKFSEFLKTLELESARDTHSVEQTKKILVEVCNFFQRERERERERERGRLTEASRMSRAHSHNEALDRRERRRGRKNRKTNIQSDRPMGTKIQHFNHQEISKTRLCWFNVSVGLLKEPNLTYSN